MNEHLALKVRGKYANLPEDFSIDIEDVNPIFNDYESYSFDAPLNIETNRHILKDLDRRIILTIDPHHSLCRIFGILDLTKCYQPFAMLTL